ncbi:MAG: hypothetical protein ACO25B_05945 [Chitinophagaceae bacterium]
MKKIGSILPAFLLLAVSSLAQTGKADTTIVPLKQPDTSIIDTTIDYEQLFQDLDEFLDSILSPHSYLLVNMSIGKGYYNFENKSNFDLNTYKKLVYSPAIGYYHKSGLGITVTGYMVDDGSGTNFYQTGVSPSWDYLQNKDFATGISYTKFFTKDSLPFYTTPIQNELYAYFTYRKWWLRPTLALSYGWGSRSDYQQRETLIQDLRLRQRGFTYINTRESVSDFSLVASVRHDFYWLDVITYRDHIRFTPQLSFTSGTQKFGFNQSSSTYATILRNNSNVLYNTDEFYLDDKLKFQPLSLTFFLRGEYAIGKFFVQPQLAFDYFFPATTRKFNTLFSLNAGFMF